MARPLHPIPYPPPASLVSSEAAKWYLEAVRAIPGTLGRDREPMELLETAWALKARLRLAAALSLVDVELAEEFLRAMALPSIDALLRQAGAPDDADAPRKALAKVLSITVLERRAFPGTVGESIGMEVTTGDETQVMTEQGWKPKEGGGFLPGWQVNTPEGSRRIDQVKVGDLVMSAPPDGSAGPQPRRVLKIHRREGCSARFLSSSIPNQVGRTAVVMAADATQLWVEDRGWTRVDQLAKDAHLRLLAGTHELIRNDPLYRTTRPGIAWVQQTPRADDFGSHFDVQKHEMLEASGGQPYLEAEIRDSDERYLRTTVFELEVEGFGTCYVNGYWARCA